MARRAEKRLTDLKVKSTKLKPGRHGDGQNLFLVVSKSGSRKWCFLFRWRGKPTEMGLGGLSQVSLAAAREKAASARTLLGQHVNPLDARRTEERAQRKIKTFGEVADELLASKQREWRNAKHRGQWESSLTVAASQLRSIPIDKIDTAAILAVLKPLWLEKPETAARLRGRIEAVLDAGKAQGLRSGENVAAWGGHLAHLLPKRATLSKSHFAAMNYRDVPEFVARLREVGSVSALALEFCVLTAARSGEIYGATWDEIDLAAKVWTLPPDRMKSGRQHRVPLSARAVEIVQALAEVRTCEFVFPSPRGQKPLSHVAMGKVMSRLNIEGATVHGFRSAFRDWAGNETGYARELAESALAHVIGDKAEQAYRRSDALERRRELMAAWASWCAPETAGNVVSIARGAMMS